jgi:hypothetical protein
MVMIFQRCIGVTQPLFHPAVEDYFCNFLPTQLFLQILLKIKNKKSNDHQCKNLE